MLILVGPDQSGKRMFPLPAPHKTSSFTIGVSQQTTENHAEGQYFRSIASTAPLKAHTSTAVVFLTPLSSCWLQRSCKSIGVGEKLCTVGGKNDNGVWLHSPHSCPKPPSHWALLH